MYVSNYVCFCLSLKVIESIFFSESDPLMCALILQHATRVWLCPELFPVFDEDSFISVWGHDWLMFTFCDVVSQNPALTLKYPLLAIRFVLFLLKWPALRYIDACTDSLHSGFNWCPRLLLLLAKPLLSVLFSALGILPTLIKICQLIGGQRYLKLFLPPCGHVLMTSWSVLYRRVLLLSIIAPHAFIKILNSKDSYFIDYSLEWVNINSTTPHHNVVCCYEQCC